MTDYNLQVKSSITRVLIAGVTILSVPSLLLGTSCKEEDATPPPGGVPTIPTWSADGIISSGEYAEMVTYGDYEIHWRSDGQYIYVGMKAPTSGWVAMGIQLEPKQNTDMIFGFVKDGEPFVYDLFGAAHPGSHPQDTGQGGTNDIANFGGREEGGYTIIEFKRELNTQDQYDLPLSSGTNKIIWAYGSQDMLDSRHDRRGYGEIEL